MVKYTDLYNTYNGISNKKKMSDKNKGIFEL